MEMLVSVHVLVLLFVHAAHAHKGSQGLYCVNDFVNNVSCTWDGSPLDPGVDCWVFGVKTTWIFKNNMRVQGTVMRSCKLKQHRNSPPGCSFVFEKEKFNPFKNISYISMECNGTLVQNLTNYSPYDHIQMHPPGIPNVSCTANETVIWWRLGRPLSDYFESFHFQIQIKQRNTTWNEASNISTIKQELRIPTWKLKGLCQVRVRVKPTEQLHKSHWSSWSPATEWLGAADVWETSEDPRDNTLSALILGQTSIWGMMFIFSLVIVALVLYRSRGLLKGKPVPSPSKYFHTLNSVHGGNLKKWLNPLSASESFFMVQPCDRISPVEVCEDSDVVSNTSPSSSLTSTLLHFPSDTRAGSDTSGVVENSSSSSSSSSSSCFSNMGYFMSSSSSSSARTDPNPAYFTHQDHSHRLHGSHNLHLCPTFNTSPAYKCLKREPQSPDSGFGIRKEDEEDKDDQRVVGAEEKEVSYEDQRPPLLILPLYHPSQMCPPSSASGPPNTTSLTPISSTSQRVEAASTDGGSFAAWPKAGAMCRSSSMPVEPFKTGYLTLKELQTTFSNKSI